jgi:Fur family ferric uptake transcriptional regulator
MTANIKKTITGKTTKHKVAILQLFELHKHLDASQIYSILNNRSEKVSFATIYRVLSAFESEGLIMKNNFTSLHAVYEFANPTEHHDHLICTKCNKVFEFFNNKLEKLQEKIALEHEFKIISHHLNMYGICKSCLLL